MGFYLYMAWDGMVWDGDGDGMLWDGDGDGIYELVSMYGWMAGFSFSFLFLSFSHLRTST